VVAFRPEAIPILPWLNPATMPVRAAGESAGAFARGMANFGVASRGNGAQRRSLRASQAGMRASAFPARLARRITLRFTIHRSRERNRCARLPLRVSASTSSPSISRSQCPIIFRSFSQGDGPVNLVEQHQRLGSDTQHDIARAKRCVGGQSPEIQFPFLSQGASLVSNER